MGDIVTAVEGHEIGSSTALQTVVKEYKAGEALTLTVYRNGEMLTLTVTLDENTAQRAADMDALQAEYEEAYRQQQQQQQQQQQWGGWSWPFGYGW